MEIIITIAWIASILYAARYAIGGMAHEFGLPDTADWVFAVFFGGGLALLGGPLISAGRLIYLANMKFMPENIAGNLMETIFPEPGRPETRLEKSNRLMMEESRRNRKQREQNERQRREINAKERALGMKESVWH